MRDIKSLQFEFSIGTLEGFLEHLSKQKGDFDFKQDYFYVDEDGLEINIFYDHLIGMQRASLFVPRNYGGMPSISQNSFSGSFILIPYYKKN